VDYSTRVSEEFDHPQWRPPYVVGKVPESFRFRCSQKNPQKNLVGDLSASVPIRYSQYNDIPTTHCQTHEVITVVLFAVLFMDQPLWSILAPKKNGDFTGIEPRKIHTI
jgi:hypothetical protein